MASAAVVVFLFCSTAFGVVLIARGHEVGGGDQRTDVGTLARIDRRVTLPGNRLGVLCTGLYTLRFVTHLDVTADDIDRALPVLRELLSA